MCFSQRLATGRFPPGLCETRQGRGSANDFIKSRCDRHHHSSSNSLDFSEVGAILSVNNSPLPAPCLVLTETHAQGILRVISVAVLTETHAQGILRVISVAVSLNPRQSRGARAATPRSQLPTPNSPETYPKPLTSIN
jgi:hypothetical protein